MILSRHQQEIFTKITNFLDKNEKKCFILKGYAGTGKTTMIRFIIDYLMQQPNTQPVVMASTGRAAKVLQDKTRFSATTIHAQIYYFEGVEGFEGITLDEKNELQEGSEPVILGFGVKEMKPQTTERQVFIVDEASMLSHLIEEERNYSSKYGTGSILDDFMNYTKKHQVIFVGDPCQLPPVAKDTFSSALEAAFLKQHYTIEVEEAELKEIHRQNEDSEIVQMATKMRTMINQPINTRFPKIPMPKGKQVRLYSNTQQMLNAYLKNFSQQDLAKCIMLADSNKKCLEINQKIRQALGKPKDIQVGDLLMVMQNSHISGLVNGDQVIVKEISEFDKKVGYTMLMATLEGLHTGKEYKTLLIKEFLNTNDASLPLDDSTKILLEFDRRMKQKNILRNTKPYIDALHKDPFVNALRAKYGYCVTCHKSQGGEWEQVFLNLDSALYSRSPVEIMRWYYTAITRTKQHLHITDGWWVDGFRLREQGIF